MSGPTRCLTRPDTDPARLMADALAARTFHVDGAAYVVDILSNGEEAYESPRPLPPTLGVGLCGLLAAFPNVPSPTDLEAFGRGAPGATARLRSHGAMTGIGGAFLLDRMLSDWTGMPRGTVTAALSGRDLLAEFERALFQTRRPHLVLDFFDGLAGFAWGMCLHGTDTEVAHFAPVLDGFAALCERLPGDPDRFGPDYGGLAHGRTGLAMGLAAMAARRRDEALWAAAEAHARADLARLDDGAVMDHRRTPGAVLPINRMFCNGLLGLAAFQGLKRRHGREWQVLASPPFDALMVDVSFCHGLPAALAAWQAGLVRAHAPSDMDGALGFVEREIARIAEGAVSLTTNLSWNTGAVSLLTAWANRDGPVRPTLFDILAGAVPSRPGAPRPE